MDFTFAFLKLFGLALQLTAPLLLVVAMIITLLGQLVGRREGWGHFDAFYWSFITATTVGYGDMYPQATFSRMLSIIIALLGLILTGLVVSIAVYAATQAFTHHADIDGIKARVEQIR